jgi:Zn finger protein HypA/HybF involved in hydrogenase expression
MHEVSLVHALFDQVDGALVNHPGATLRQITVRIGTRAGVEFDLFRTAFEATKELRGHPVADLRVDVEAAAYRCVDCGAVVLPGDVLSCAECQGKARLTQGGDLILERMELEVSDV